MKKFEYKVVNTNTIYSKYGAGYYDERYQSYFNDLGKEGWELVAVDSSLFYFKREINSNASSSYTTKD
ncbi:MAG: DUF4177 domain-containing protein [Clostridia bacterium]|nr:DUF4177 domain-containing protein [Clostridia bacterium]